MPDSHAPRPLVVVTRPVEQASAWVEGLRSAGWPVLPLPLIAIAPLADPPSLRAAVGAWADWQAVMFVSPAAVAALRQAGMAVPPAPLRCWAPGAGTARALRDWGVAPSCIDEPPAGAAQMDTETLWPVIAPQLHPGCRVLVVRGVSADGHEGRDWLVRRCQDAGATVHTVQAYRRQPPTWDPAQRAAAQSAVESGAIWLFSSSEAIAHLHALLPHAPWGQARAVVTHPRIAATARARGWQAVRTSRPALADIVQALESFS